MENQYTITETQPGTTSLSVRGSLTIDQSHDFKNSLEQLLKIKGKKIIEISLEDISSIDVSCLQLLFGFHKALQSNKTKLSIAWPKNTAVYSLINNAGLKKAVETF